MEVERGMKQCRGVPTTVFVKEPVLNESVLL